jgi:hypothetical protein
MMVDHDDHGDETELDLAPVLDRAMEAMRQKVTELGQATKTMVARYREDTIKLNECVATELEPPQRESGLDTCACLRRMIEQERERLEHNTTRMQRARSFFSSFSHDINSSIASPEREVVCT